MTPEQRAADLAKPKLSRIPPTDQERAAMRAPDIPPKPFGKPFSAMRFTRNLDTKHYVETLEQNQKLNLCCRHVEESRHTAQYYSTPFARVMDDGRSEPDILIIRCGQCNRRHIRFFLGADERTVLEVR